MISGFVFVDWVVCSLASVSPGILQPMVVVCCQFFLPFQLACSQGMPAGVEGWATGMIWGRKAREGLCNPWGTGLERKGRPQEASSCRPGDETWGIRSQDQ